MAVTPVATWERWLRWEAMLRWEQWEELVGSTRARARRPFVGRGMLVGMAAVMQVSWT